MELNIFRKEDTKYSQLWQNGYKEANWKKLISAVIDKAEPCNQHSLVDFGFGMGAALDFFEKKGFYVE